MEEESMSIPATTRITARPVWKRHRQRTLSNINPLPPPTEREKQDAIRVLEDPTYEAFPGLWEEAHRIFMEAGQ
jgi:hypothetical protein